MSELKPKWYQVRLSFMGKFLFILFGVPALLIGALRLYEYIHEWLYPPMFEYYAKHPELKVKPIDLQGQKILAIHGIPESNFGYSFELPWESIKEHDEIGHTQPFELYFSSDNERINFMLDSELDSDLALNTAINHDDGNKNWAIKPSKYDLLSAALNASPDDENIWASHANKVRLSLALDTKLFSMNEARKIQRIQFGEMRGFEFSDQPKFNEYQLILFDKKDRVLKFWYTPKKDEAESVTQEKINSIVASMHAVSPQTTDAAASRH